VGLVSSNEWEECTARVQENKEDLCDAGRLQYGKGGYKSLGNIKDGVEIAQGKKKMRKRENRER